MAEAPTSPSAATASPFLRLPPEIRLQIYALLILPQEPSHLHPSSAKLKISIKDSFDYDKKQRSSDRVLDGDVSSPTLLIRTIDRQEYDKQYGTKTFGPRYARTTYGDKDRFRAKFWTTTYHCVNNSCLAKNAGIVRTNKRIHAEVIELLYSSYTFDFDIHIEAMRPFLSDLTPFARSRVRSLRFVKRALAYDKEYDRIEWANALQHLTSPSSHLDLRSLELGIVAGRPGVNGWSGVYRYSAENFRAMRGSDGMQWLEYLLELKGLEALTVTAVVEHCPFGSDSAAMSAFVRFSASVEAGFAQFLQESMIAPS